jgi:hypothetical protein
MWIGATQQQQAQLFMMEWLQSAQYGVGDLL